MGGPVARPPVLAALGPGAHWRTGGHPAGTALFDLYHDLPATQIGPVALLVSAPFAALGDWQGRLVVCAAMLLAFPALLAIGEDTANRLHPGTADRRRTAEVAAIAGAVGMLMWRQLAVIGMHLDDVLAVLFAALAMNAVVRRHPRLVGLCVALALCSKPWAATFLPLVLAIPGRRARIEASLAAGITTLLLWGPFIAVHGTLAALDDLRIGVSEWSGLILLGYQTEQPMPGWVRPAQLVIGVALGSWFVYRGRWAAVPLVGIAVRISLDAGTWSYYYGSLVAAAALWDLVGSRRRFPWWTLATMFIEYDLKWLLSTNIELVWVDALPIVVALGCALLVPPARTPGAPSALRLSWDHWWVRLRPARSSDVQKV